MPRFRRKPMEIEAVRASEVQESIKNGEWNDLPRWFTKVYDAGNVWISALDIIVFTGVDRERAGPRDWIIRDSDGLIKVREHRRIQEDFDPVAETPVRP